MTATQPRLRLLAHPDQCDVTCCDFQPEGHWHGPTDALQESFEIAVAEARQQVVEQIRYRFFMGRSQGDTRREQEFATILNEVLHDEGSPDAD